MQIGGEKLEVHRSDGDLLDCCSFGVKAELMIRRLSR